MVMTRKQQRAMFAKRSQVKRFVVPGSQVRFITKRPALRSMAFIDLSVLNINERRKISQLSDTQLIRASRQKGTSNRALTRAELAKEFAVARGILRKR